MRVCVTGATGFVGARLVDRLEALGHDVTAVARSRPAGFKASNATHWVERDLVDDSWPFEFLEGTDVLVHLAARAHVIKEQNTDPLQAFRRVNVHPTHALARAAAAAGVKRMIFASSIGVHGAATEEGRSITESSPVTPSEPYARSKWEAEEQLQEISRRSGLDVVVLRPALTAGAGAPGNFARLANVTRRELPMTVPWRDNTRSFVSLNNLTSLLVHCLDHPAAGGKTFVVADRQWASTREVMQWIAEGAGVRLRTIPLPDRLLRMAAGLAGKSQLYGKLFGDLRVDATRIHTELGWEPEESLADAVRAVGKASRE